MVNFIQTCTPNRHNLTVSNMQKDRLESCMDCNGGSEIVFQGRFIRGSVRTHYV
jgi:hypothetical protein